MYFQMQPQMQWDVENAKLSIKHQLLDSHGFSPNLERNTFEKLKKKKRQDNVASLIELIRHQGLVQGYCYCLENRFQDHLQSADYIGDIELVEFYVK